MNNSEKINRDPAVRLHLGRAGRWLVRLDRPVFDDPPPASPADPSARPAAAETRRLLERIGKLLCPDAADRRREIRHEAVEREAWVGWWAGRNFGSTHGRVVNISRGGVLVVLGHRPPRKTPVWIYKDTGPGLSSVRGEVAGIAAAPGGDFAVRLRFATPCPTDLCAVVVCGRPSATRKGVGPGVGRQT